MFNIPKSTSSFMSQTIIYYTRNTVTLLLTNLVYKQKNYWVKSMFGSTYYEYNIIYSNYIHILLII